MCIRGRFLPGGVVLAGAVACSTNGTTIIDTIGNWGGAKTAVWDHVGQEFAALAIDNVLHTFEFGVGGQAGTYSFSIYEWDVVGSQVVGGALFATSTLAIPDTSVVFVTFDVGEPLTPGGLYVAVISFESNKDGGVGRGVAFMSGDFYPGGTAVFTELPVDEPWQSGSPTSFELAFRAVFNAGAPPCPWDCGDSGDGNVGIVDFLALLGEWGQVGTPCDVDDGGVGINDFLALLANWGPCPQ